MATALNVAKYFLTKVDRDAGDLITQLKLQKLVYYAKAWSLAINEKSIFDETLEAWINGPVAPSVWTEFKEYKIKSIPAPSEYEIEITLEEKDFLDEIWSVYGDLSASKLWRLSHQEHPWIIARGGIPSDQASSNPISEDDLKEYYSNFIDVSTGGVHPEALSESKEPGTLINLYSEGCKDIVQVRLDELKSFINNSPDHKTIDRRRQASFRSSLSSMLFATRNPVMDLLCDKS